MLLALNFSIQIKLSVVKVVFEVRFWNFIQLPRSDLKQITLTLIKSGCSIVVVYAVWGSFR